MAGRQTARSRSLRTHARIRREISRLLTEPYWNIKALSSPDRYPISGKVLLPKPAHLYKNGAIIVSQYLLR